MGSVAGARRQCGAALSLSKGTRRVHVVGRLDDTGVARSKRATASGTTSRRPAAGRDLGGQRGEGMRQWDGRSKGECDAAREGYACSPSVGGRPQAQQANGKRWLRRRHPTLTTLGERGCLVASSAGFTGRWMCRHVPQPPPRSHCSHLRSGVEDAGRFRAKGDRPRASFIPCPACVSPVRDCEHFKAIFPVPSSLLFSLLLSASLRG